MEEIRSPGYILALGNGLPHKNLGILAEIAAPLARQIVLRVFQARNQMYWKGRYPAAAAA